jgi:homoserine acetyltransferase
LIALLNTWQSGDISIIHDIHDGGDYEKGLKNIEEKTLIMPSKTDFHCPVSPVLSNREPATDAIKAGGQ